MMSYNILWFQIKTFIMLLSFDILRLFFPRVFVCSTLLWAGRAPWDEILLIDCWWQQQQRIHR